jgi:Ca2+-binding RTX toxin-like protein
MAGSELANGTGSTLDLDDSAFAAGIREVIGGTGVDVITFGTAYNSVSVKVDGGAGEDIITTAGGNDTIKGGAGEDNITPGLGTDTIAYTDITNEGGDTITNFTTIADGAFYAAGDDVLQFSEADLSGLSGFADYTGVGTSINIGSYDVEFVSGGAPSASGTEAAFLFNQTTGELSFDADGTDAGGAIVIATLTGVTDLAAADFTFVA